MLSVRLRKTNKGEPSRWKLLIWTAVASLVFGLINFGEPAENMLRVARNSLHVHKASGDIALVAIDDRSLREIGRWPWPRSQHAKLTDQLSTAGAKRVFFDIQFNGRSDPSDDALFTKAISSAGNVILPVSARPDIGVKDAELQIPTIVSKHAELGLISAAYNYQNVVWRLDYAGKVSNKEIPTFAAKLANARGQVGQNFIPDYSTNPASIPVISAADLLNGRADLTVLKGKDVVVGATAEGIDQYYIPGWGKMGGAYVQILGAETLRSGKVMYLGWLPALLVALGACWLATTRRSAGQSNLILGIAASTLSFGTAALEARQIFFDVTPALFSLVIVGTALTWRRWRQRGLVNTVSGLPNLSALRAFKAGREQALIAARVLNYAEIAAALPPEQERLLIEQIVSRLRVGAPERTLYEGDGGIFAWFEDTRVPFANHIEALYTLFRNPARVDGMSIDLTISFGVEIGSGRS
ncbi:MAG TPA: CHASE2 domain-containing protein, partial [Sphingomicrobium sp.]|nr:CHASE2 domain-containing protein [Sphingomicrobium sp.]